MMLDREKKRVREREYYQKTKDRRNELARQSYHKNKEQHYKNTRRYVMKTKYGITPDDYQQMLESQDYSCLICGGEEVDRTLAVDHCHDTGVVRGLLCGPCNRGLGLFKDNPLLLESAAEYLRANGGKD